MEYQPFTVEFAEVSCDRTVKLRSKHAFALNCTASEPKDTATLLEQTFSYLTKTIIARISEVVK